MSNMTLGEQEGRKTSDVYAASSFPHVNGHLIDVYVEHTETCVGHMKSHEVTSEMLCPMHSISNTLLDGLPAWRSAPRGSHASRDRETDGRTGGERAQHWKST